MYTTEFNVDIQRGFQRQADVNDDMKNFYYANDAHRTIRKLYSLNYLLHIIVYNNRAATILSTK